MRDEKELTELVTRGFAGVRDQIRERDDRVTQLSEKMVGVEFKIDQLKETLGKLENHISEAETERIKMRIEHLEDYQTKSEKKQEENSKWIKGLVASVIILLLGVIFNSLRMSLR